MLHLIEKLRLYNLSSNLFHVFEPLPHGDFLLVIYITFLGYLLTPLQCSTPILSAAFVIYLL